MAGKARVSHQPGLSSADTSQAHGAHWPLIFFEREIMSHREQEIAKIKKDWAENPRWKGR